MQLSTALVSEKFEPLIAELLSSSRILISILRNIDIVPLPSHNDEENLVGWLLVPKRVTKLLYLPQDVQQMV